MSERKVRNIPGCFNPSYEWGRFIWSSVIVAWMLSVFVKVAFITPFWVPGGNKFHLNVSLCMTVLQSVFMWKTSHHLLRLINVFTISLYKYCIMTRVHLFVLFTVTWLSDYIWIWIDNRIYCTLTDRNYKYKYYSAFANSHTLLFTTAPTKSSQSTVSSPVVAW
jgi:hypothetical protein